MSAHLIVFAKNPVPGTVKTRLQRRYSPDQAAAIYRAFILDVIESAGAAPADQRVLAYAPSDAVEAMATLVGDNWRLRPQADADLGARMSQAAADSFSEGADRVVILGTDAPSLPDARLTRAFDLLRTTDVVLGPSTDGGYYLVGLSQPFPEIFDGIDWSTEHVFRQTVDRIRSAGLRLGLLPPWYDVDTPDELEFLRTHLDAARHAGEPIGLPNTIAALEECAPPATQFPTRS